MDRRNLETFERFCFTGDVSADLEKILATMGLVPNQETGNVRVMCVQHDGYTDVFVEATDKKSANPAMASITNYIESGGYNPSGQVIVNRCSGEFRGH